MEAKPKPSDTSRVEAFSDGVFAIAITLLILEIRVPPDVETGLDAALLHLWPSYLAFVSSFATIGVMWINHHRLFALISRVNDGVIGLNLLLLLGITWLPFPTALLAEHLRGGNQHVAAMVYGATFVFLAVIFNVLWRYAIRSGIVVEHINVSSISRQYALGPLLYAVVTIVGLFSAVACLVLSTALAIYFALPPRLWQRSAASRAHS